MIIKKAELIAVAVKKEQYPPDNMPEIAFVGRSNVGKSSLFNLLVNIRGLARVSGSPGKTRTINFYEINGRFRIVDLPGYGYAKLSRSVSDGWGKMIEGYFNSRKGLVKAVQLVDIRHAPSDMDVLMYDYLRHFKLDGIVVATKADKVSRSELAKCFDTIKKTLNLTGSDALIPVSTLKKTGHEDLMAAVDSLLEADSQVIKE